MRTVLHVFDVVALRGSCVVLEPAESSQQAKTSPRPPGRPVETALPIFFTATGNEPDFRILLFGADFWESHVKHRKTDNNVVHKEGLVWSPCLKLGWPHSFQEIIPQN